MISGRLTYPPEIDAFTFTSFNFLKVEKNGRVGLLHYDGTILADIEYDEVNAEEDARQNIKYVYVRSGQKWGINNTKNETVFAIEYDELGKIDKNGNVIAKRNGKDIILDVRKKEEK